MFPEQSADDQIKLGTVDFRMGVCPGLQRVIVFAEERSARVGHALRFFVECAAGCYEFLASLCAEFLQESLIPGWHLFPGFARRSSLY